MNRIAVCILFSFVFLSLTAQKEKKEKPISPLEYKGGKLEYTPDALGNRIPDFSFAGYGAGEKAIPNDAPTLIIPEIEGDATSCLQQAIDWVEAMKPDKRGIRAVILLESGDYKIEGQLKIKQSSIVLRGAGANERGTRIIATGNDRRTLIAIEGKNDKTLGTAIAIADEYVPVNAIALNVESNHKLNIGDKVFVNRPSTQEWINALGTEHFGGGITALGWKVGNHDINWDRTIVAIDGNRITLDAPLTTALEKQYGGGSIIPYIWQGRIENVGIENMTLVSQYDLSNPKDEAHAWTGISIDNASDIWVRKIVFEHFAGSALIVGRGAKRVTVETCKSLSPISEIGGYRRNTFITYGQQTLFHNIYAENGYHDFTLGLGSAGPNAFVQCHSHNSYSFSGSIESWSSGTLFDIVNVDSHALSFKNRYQRGQGAGWNAANSVFWQCTASLIECFAPPTAQNWSFGSWGDFSGNGYWENSNNHIKPRSLYYAQLQERLAKKYVDNSNLLNISTEASSSPQIEVARILTTEAVKPASTLSEWIDELLERSDMTIERGKVKQFEFKENTSIKTKNTARLSIINGLLVKENTALAGNSHSVQWWSGNLKPNYINKSSSPHLTRFVPGISGVGFTDNVDETVQWMKEKNMVVLDHNYGLWYDRRRDDHERIRRIDGDVWAPFYEQPFARSGQGSAYDGLSKYDLTKYNPWYWMRLKQFADMAEENDMVLLHQNYFQHNIIEAGAHWTDSPWRPANNINKTGFPEPAPYAGDKRIFLSEQFYDIQHPVRRELHRAYIRQCLDNFGDNSNVIQLISEEYTGPLHFVEFWLDVIAEWEKEKNMNVKVALSTTKDVQDAILADPIRSKVIDIIDIRYWFYQDDGIAYEPKGGLNLAPRQHARLTKVGKASFASVYRAVKEYRTKHPEKAVTYYSNSYPQQAWAAFMAGGSLAGIPRIENKAFLQDRSKMDVIEEMSRDGQYTLGNPEKGYIIYSENQSISIDLSPNNKRKYDVYKVHQSNGAVTKNKEGINASTRQILKNNNEIIWLKLK